MYHQPDIRWHVLNDTMSQYYLHYYRILGLNGVYGPSDWYLCNLMVVCQGADIADIEQVIQFGVPLFLAVWIQCTGHAGRSPVINARAILLVEKSMFQWRKKRKMRRQVGDDSEESGLEVVEEESEDNEEQDEIGADSNKMEYGKKVELELRRWIEWENCRRDIAD